MIAMAAYMGRRIYIKHGHSTIYPNQYALLLGEAGTRKSTAIKSASDLLREAGYKHFSAAKTTKEKFLLDLSGDEEGDMSTDSFFDLSNEDKEDAECLINADEGMDFFGQSNLEFIATLGQLWDFNGIFESKIKNGKSASILNPTLTILAGFTPTNFSLSFPPEILGQGFFSRTVIIHAPPSGRKIAFPDPPDEEKKAKIVERMVRIRNTIVGEITLDEEAKQSLTRIYEDWEGLHDPRFSSYATRRFQHMLKLCLILAVLEESKVISKQNVIQANTLLTLAEKLMPEALGEFGKSKNAEVSHKVLGFLSSAMEPKTVRQIYKAVHTEVDSLQALTQVLSGLLAADKIQLATPGAYLPKKHVTQKVKSSLADLIDYSFLTEEERRLA